MRLPPESRAVPKRRHGSLDPDEEFDRAVVLVLADGHRHTVASIRAAVNVLLYRWPGTSLTRQHRAARRTCLRALKGVEDVRHARHAFEAAARAVGLVRDP